MKIPGVFFGVLALLGLALLGGAAAQQQQQTGQATQAPPSPQAPASSQGATPTSLPGVLLSTETLLGTDVKSAQGEEVGEIRQLMIDPRSGRVLYAVIGMGGFLGLGEKDILVPWSAMDVARDGSALVLNVSRQLLQQAPEYKSGQSTEPLNAQGSGGWGSETPYGRLYDPAKEQTVRGQVTSIGTAAPMQGMTPGTQIQVQTEDGKTTQVQLGPEWYLERQDGMPQANTRVQITGSLVEVEGQPVLLAREVQFDGQSLTLRDAQGRPMWSSSRRNAP